VTKLLRSFHSVFHGPEFHDDQWLVPEKRLEAIRTTRELRPGLELDRSCLPKAREELETRAKSFSYYLYGLRQFVFFSYGTRYRFAGGPSLASFTADTAWLIHDLGALVVIDECIEPSEVVPHLFDSHPWWMDDGSAPEERFSFDLRQWEADPSAWEQNIWTKLQKEVLPKLTYSGDDAMDFLMKIEDDDLGINDILVPRPVPLQRLQEVSPD